MIRHTERISDWSVCEYTDHSTAPPPCTRLVTHSTERCFYVQESGAVQGGGAVLHSVLSHTDLSDRVRSALSV